MSIESQIKAINDAGYKINNLFQLDEDFWRCNVRGPDHTFSEFGNGDTPETALIEVQRKMKKVAVVVEEEDFSDILGV